MSYYDFVYTKKYQAIVRIEADSLESAAALADELRNEDHKIFRLDENDLSCIELKYNDDKMRDVLLKERDLEAVRIMILEPEKEARIASATIEYECFFNEIETHFAEIANGIFLVYGNDGAINRAARAPNGQREIIHGTAAIIKFDDGKLVNITDDDISKYLAPYFSPETFLILDGFIGVFPQNPI